MGPRNDTYGNPYEDMHRVARLWSAFLGFHVRPDQVAWCMVLLKTSRLANTPDHWDSQVDVVGWAAVAAETRAVMDSPEAQIALMEVHP